MLSANTSNNNPRKYYESNVVECSCIELITHEVSHHKYYRKFEQKNKDHINSANFVYLRISKFQNILSFLKIVIVSFHHLLSLDSFHYYL